MFRPVLPEVKILNLLASVDLAPFLILGGDGSPIAGFPATTEAAVADIAVVQQGTGASGFVLHNYRPLLIYHGLDLLACHGRRNVSADRLRRGRQENETKRNCSCPNISASPSQLRHQKIRQALSLLIFAWRAQHTHLTRTANGKRAILGPIGRTTIDTKNVGAKLPHRTQRPGGQTCSRWPLLNEAALLPRAAGEFPGTATNKFIVFRLGRRNAASCSGVPSSTEANGPVPSSSSPLRRPNYLLALGTMRSAYIGWTTPDLPPNQPAIAPNTRATKARIAPVDTTEAVALAASMACCFALSTTA